MSKKFLTKSEQLKRKTMDYKKQAHNSLSSSDEEELFFLVLFIKEKSYSVVSEDNLVITGDDTGIFKYRNIKYDVQIIKRG